MITSRAAVPTTNASRYLQQLCKHWSHKFEVDFTPTHGSVPLPAGTAVMDADPEQLVVLASAADEPSIGRLETVLEDHLRRFAFREELDFAWVRDAKD